MELQKLYTVNQRMYKDYGNTNAVHSKGKTMIIKEFGDYELFLHPVQRLNGTMTKLNLELYLQITGQIARVRSLEDEDVRGWIADPSSYPQELRELPDGRLDLWGTIRGQGYEREIVQLLWKNERVKVVSEKFKEKPKGKSKDDIELKAELDPVLLRKRRN